MHEQEGPLTGVSHAELGTEERARGLGSEKGKKLARHDQKRIRGGDAKKSQLLETSSRQGGA